MFRAIRSYIILSEPQEVSEVNNAVLGHPEPISFPAAGAAPTLRKHMNVLLTRTQEIQKVHAHVFAGLADAQEDQVLLNAFRRGHSFDRST